MSFSIIIDIVLLVIAVLIILKFTYRGFLRSILDTLKFPMALLLAYLVRIPVANLFNNLFINRAVVPWVQSSLLSSASGGDTFIDFAKLYKYVPGLYTVVLKHFGLENPERLESLGGVKETYIEELGHDIGSSVSLLFSNLLAVIVLFVVIVILMSILIKFLDQFTKITVINVVNRVLGFGLGVGLAFVTLWGASLGLELIVRVFGNMAPQVLNEAALEKSMAVSLFDKIDIIGWFNSTKV